MDKPNFDDGGTFRNHRFLARGARGETWYAENAATGRPVVLKLRPRAPEVENLARREQALLSGLDHPNLQRLLDVLGDGGTIALVYNFVAGPTLREVLDTAGAIPVAQIGPLLDGLLDGLQQLHVRGGAHRDISPENIVLQDQGAVLIDFDATGLLDQSSALGQTTIVGQFAGKPLYMSPEQLAGAPQSAAADIWSLGAVIYEMATGVPLRNARDLGGLIREVMAPPDLTRLPEPLRSLVAEMLNVDPAARPSAAEVRARLAETGPPRPAATASAPTPAPSPAPFAAAPRSFRAPLAVLAGLAIAGALVSVAYLGLLSLTFDGPPDPGVSVGLLFLVACLALGAFGLALHLRSRREVPERTVFAPAPGLRHLDGPDGRKELMHTVIQNLEPHVAQQGVVGFQIAALAREYVDAEDSAARLEALKTLIEVHHRASHASVPAWRDPDKMIARGIALTSLVAGIVAAVEGVRRLF